MSDQNPTLAALSAVGTSVWLDDLSRSRLSSGNLAELIATRSVVGVTTNPAIFANAMQPGSGYDEQLEQLAASDADAAAAVFTMASDDVAAACDLFAPVHAATGGVDGRVSIEVDPRLAHDAAATVAQAAELWESINRPNLLIKIPATRAGLTAIADTIAAGISVNVTLIFSVERYREVVEAYLTGLERAAAAGHDLATIESVASFFVSRVDSAVDAQLSADHATLAGTAGLANARLAYGAFRELFAGQRWEELAAQGAHVQRPLWASTGVKNPDYPATLYVSELAGPATVNTMPEATLQATADSEAIHGDTLTGTAGDAAATFNDLAAAGVNMAQVCEDLETDGVAKFITSWEELLERIDAHLTELRAR